MARLLEIFENGPNRGIQLQDANVLLAADQ
jgi:hypothetical protein